MQKYLIIYSTTDGQTEKIANKLQELITNTSAYVTLISIDDVESINIKGFDKIIIGASIRYGKHSLKVHKFVEEHSNILNEKICAFFSVNLVARKKNKNKGFNNPYVIKFLKNTIWSPKIVTVFAGKVNYSKYQLIDRIMIQFIMFLTKGPTDKNSVIEFTDWNKVELFAHDIINLDYSMSNFSERGN